MAQDLFHGELFQGTEASSPDETQKPAPPRTVGVEVRHTDNGVAAVSQSLDKCVHGLVQFGNVLKDLAAKDDVEAFVG